MMSCIGKLSRRVKALLALLVLILGVSVPLGMHYWSGNTGTSEVLATTITKDVVAEDGTLIPISARLVRGEDDYHGMPSYNVKLTNTSEMKKHGVTATVRTNDCRGKTYNGDDHMSVSYGDALLSVQLYGKSSANGSYETLTFPKATLQQHGLTCKPFTDGYTMTAKGTTLRFLKKQPGATYMMSMLNDKAEASLAMLLDCRSLSPSTHELVPGETLQVPEDNEIISIQVGDLQVNADTEAMKVFGLTSCDGAGRVFEQSITVDGTAYTVEIINWAHHNYITAFKDSSERQSVTVHYTDYDCVGHFSANKFMSWASPELMLSERTLGNITVVDDSSTRVIGTFDLSKAAPTLKDAGLTSCKI